MSRATSFVADLVSYSDKYLFEEAEKLIMNTFSSWEEDGNFIEVDNILYNIDFNKIKTEEDVINAKKSIQHLGDSIEKDLILARLNQLIPKTNK